MASKVEILLVVDPSGQGSAGIKRVTAEVKGLAHAEEETGDKGQGLFSSFLSAEFAYNAVRKLTGAVVDFGKESVQAYAALIQDQRFLNSQIEAAGVNYAQAQKSVESFDESLTLSRTNAEKLYAVTLQFTKEIGKEGQANKFIQSLADTLIAHGVNPEEQAQITRSLLAGRATELAKVLGQNITGIEKELSTAAGVDFGKLDDASKKALIFNKILEEGEKNAGASAQRLTELDGVLAGIAARYDRAKEAAGQFITKQTFIGDLLSLLAGQNDETRAAAAQAKAQADAKRYFETLDQSIALGHREAELAKDPSKKFTSFDYFIASQDLADTKKAEIRRQAEEARDAVLANFKDISAAEKRRIERDTLDRLANLPNTPEGDRQRARAVAEAQAKAAADTAALAQTRAGDAERDTERRLTLDALRKQAEDARDALIEPYKRLFKGEGKDDLISLDFAQRQLDHIKAILNPAEAEEIGEKLREAIQRQIDKGVNYLTKVRADAQKEFTTFLQANTIGQGDNPFVAIFTDALKAKDALEKQFNVLDISTEGKRQLEILAQAQQHITDVRLAGARVDSNLTAERFRQQAQELLNIQGLTAAEERRLGILERQVSTASQIPTLLGRAAALAQGQPQVREGSTLQTQIINEQFRRLIDLGRNLSGTGEGRERAQNSIDKAITSLFDSLPERIQRQIARDPGGRAFIGGAFTREAAEQQREITREIERARVADRAVDNIRKDLDIIRRGGLTTPEADRRILAILDNLSPNELSPELKQARFDALLRRADSQGGQEAAAKAQVNASVEATNNLSAAVTQLIRAVQNPELRKILIEVINRTKASIRDDQLGTL